jgi:hypothetical protein
MAQSKRKMISGLRVLGGLALVGSIVLWWYGGKETVVSYKDVLFPLPWEVVLFCGGLLLAAIPQVFFYVLAGVIPFRPARKRLFDYASSLDPDVRKLNEPMDEVSLASLLKRHFQKADRRFYLSVPTILLAVSVVCAYLYSRGISQANFKRASNQLVALIQEKKIDFAAADAFRERLQEVGDAIPNKQIATRRIYDLLTELYDPTLRNVDDFNAKVRGMYEKEIRSHTDRGTGLLKAEDFKSDTLKSESPSSAASYLTLLATICNYEGDHGSYNDPYLQSHQLLNLALADVAQNAKLPATHNALGISWAGLLKTYPDFASKFSSNPTGLTSTLNLKSMPSRLALLREAKSEYEIAAKQSATNLAKARSINNQIDILLDFLDIVHVKNELNIKEIGDDSDRSFLETELAARIADRPWGAEKLLVVLERCRHNLTEALALSQQPEIFFTRAQLYSIGGKLNDRYKFQHPFWGASDLVAAAGVHDLESAAALSLPRQLFDKSRKDQLFLDWLWTQAKYNQTLQELGAETSE